MWRKTLVLKKEIFFLFLILFFFHVNLSGKDNKIGFYIDKNRLYREYGKEKIEELQRLQQPNMKVFKQNYNLNIPEQERTNAQIMKNWYMKMLTKDSQKKLKALQLYKTRSAQKILQPQKETLKNLLNLK